MRLLQKVRCEKDGGWRKEMVVVRVQMSFGGSINRTWF